MRNLYPLHDIPGTHPRQLTRERNVDADHFISAYLGSESQRKSHIYSLKNPVQVDYPTDRYKEVPIIPNNKSQVMLPTYMKNSDSLDQLRNNMESNQSSYNAHFRRNEARFWGIDENEKPESQKTYTRHGILGSNNVYKPQFEMNVDFKLYDRPQFKDYNMAQMPYKQVVETKNRMHRQELLTPDYVSINKQYGFGIRGYTEKPIYTYARSQNMSKE